MSDNITPSIPPVGSGGMSGGKSKPAQNSALSFELTNWLDTTQRLTEAAHDHIGKLCTREHRWAMSVPPRDDDSDILLGSAVTAGETATQALRAVLDLHTPIECEALSIDYDCAECSTYDNCETWPCPTVTTITNAIGDHQ